MKRCRTCGETAMTTTHEDLALPSLPSVTVQGVRVQRCQACGEELVSYSRIEAMHEVIVRAKIPLKLPAEKTRALKTPAEMPVENP